VFVYFGLTGARGLQAPASRLSLTDHRFYYRSNQPRRRRTDRLKTSLPPRSWQCLTGAMGLQAQASRPSLTGHRLLTTGASRPSRIASPVTSLATVNPHVVGNMPPHKSHNQRVRRPPRDEGRVVRVLSSGVDQEREVSWREQGVFGTGRKVV